MAQKRYGSINGAPTQLSRPNYRFFAPTYHWALTLLPKTIASLFFTITVTLTLQLKKFFLDSPLSRFEFLYFSIVSLNAVAFSTIILPRLKREFRLKRYKVCFSSIFRFLALIIYKIFVKIPISYENLADIDELDITGWVMGVAELGRWDSICLMTKGGDIWMGLVE